MASSKNYLEFILEQLSGLDDVTYRSMMGEYILYFRGKIIGGIYDNRFLVKPVQAVLDKIDQPSFEFPYEGAKEMILVEDLDNKMFLEDLILAMYDQLPTPKPKKVNEAKKKPTKALSLHGQNKKKLGRKSSASFGLYSCHYKTQWLSETLLTLFNLEFLMNN